MGNHAVLSASSSHRWMNCPPSVRLTEHMFDNGSVYAAEGSEAHALCEYKLRQALGQDAQNPLESPGGLQYYDNAMEDAATGYVAFVVEELEEILILADVGVTTAGKICSRLGERIKRRNIDSTELRENLCEIVTELMEPDEPLVTETKPSVVLVVGVNGVGKTTSIGKLAYWLQGQGKKVLLGAADTFRAAAGEQLGVWAERVGCQMIKHAEGADPAAVVYDSITAAKARNVDVLICDTAGRLHTKKNLMEELAKIDRVLEREAPGCSRETLLVLDATTGQNGLNQAREFAAACGVTGIILTKLDGTAKGGVAIAIRDQLGLPIKFVGTGESIGDLTPFSAAEFAQALLLNEDEE